MGTRLNIVASHSVYGVTMRGNTYVTIISRLVIGNSTLTRSDFIKAVRISKQRRLVRMNKAGSVQECDARKAL